MTVADHRQQHACCPLAGERLLLRYDVVDYDSDRNEHQRAWIWCLSLESYPPSKHAITITHCPWCGVELPDRPQLKAIG